MANFSCIGIAAASFLLVAACSSSSDTGGGGTPAASDAGSGTFTGVYSTTLGQICTQCHSGAGAPAGLDMSSKASAYANLVGVKAGGSQSACGASGLTRVVAGNADQSLLYLKVSGKQPCGGRMPLDNPALPDAQIASIQAWINAGAPND